MVAYYPIVVVQDGAPKIAKLRYKWLNSMVFGRYSYRERTSINGGVFLMNKHHWGGGHPVCFSQVMKRYNFPATWLTRFQNPTGWIPHEYCWFTRPGNLSSMK